MAVGEIVIFKIRKDGTEELATIEAQQKSKGGSWFLFHNKKNIYRESELPIDDRGLNEK